MPKALSPLLGAVASKVILKNCKSLLWNRLKDYVAGLSAHLGVSLYRRIESAMSD